MKCIILGRAIQKNAKYAHISTVISSFISKSVGVRAQTFSNISNWQNRKWKEKYEKEKIRKLDLRVVRGQIVREVIISQLVWSCTVQNFSSLRDEEEHQWTFLPLSFLYFLFSCFSPFPLKYNLLQERVCKSLHSAGNCRTLHTWAAHLTRTVHMRGLNWKFTNTHIHALGHLSQKRK